MYVVCFSYSVLFFPIHICSLIHKVKIPLMKPKFHKTHCLQLHQYLQTNSREKEHFVLTPIYIYFIFEHNHVVPVVCLTFHQLEDDNYI